MVISAGLTNSAKTSKVFVSLIQQKSQLSYRREILWSDRVFAILKQHQSALSNLGVKSLAILGSVARDEATFDSDVGLLVDLEPPLTFDRYMDVKLYLEDQLNKKVDLVTRSSLKPQIREIVEREAIRVA